MQDGVGVGRIFRDDVKASAGGELAEDCLSEGDLGVVGVGLGGEEGDGEGFEVGGKMGCRADGVIAAAGEGGEAGNEQKKCTATHDLW